MAVQESRPVLQTVTVTNTTQDTIRYTVSWDDEQGNKHIETFDLEREGSGKNTKTFQGVVKNTFKTEKSETVPKSSGYVPPSTGATPTATRSPFSLEPF